MPALADRIQALIMQGAFETGEQLNETALAQRLGATKTQVRRALAHLAALGIVTVQPRTGTYLFTMTADEFDNLNAARAALECVALKFAMATPDAARFVAQLTANVYQAQALGERHHYRLTHADLLTYRSLDRQFHRLAFEHANNPYLLAAYAPIDVKIWTLRSLLTFPEDNVKGSLVAHTAVLTHVQAGEVEEACLRLHEHIKKSFSAHARAVLGQ